MNRYKVNENIHVSDPEMAKVLVWLMRELRSIQLALDTVHDLDTVYDHKEGAKALRAIDGMLRYSDGTSADFGSGHGFYGRVDGSWAKL